MRPLLLIVILLALVGCKTCPEKPPVIVKVPVRTTVPVPAELTAPCPVARAQNRTVEAVVDAYNANVEHLDACNRRLQEIRALPTSEAGKPAQSSEE